MLQYPTFRRRAHLKEKGCPPPLEGVREGREKGRSRALPRATSSSHGCRPMVPGDGHPPPSADPGPRSSAGFDREHVVVDCRLSFRELTHEGSALEVFAVDPTELASVNGVSVPEHGAFVARVLPAELTAGPTAGLPRRGGGIGDADDVTARTKDAAPEKKMFTPVWCRDVDGGAVVVPAALEGRLRDHEASLVMLGEDWYILGLRFEVDIEVRNVFNLHGFHALARGHLRCFVVPSADDDDARVLVTTGSRVLAPLVDALPVFDAAEPPALDLLRSCAEGPTHGPFASTADDADRADRVARTAAGLFPHQLRTIQWMEGVESGDGASGEDDRGEAPTTPVTLGSRVIHSCGLEHLAGEDPEEVAVALAAADTRNAFGAGGRKRWGNRFANARAIGAALADAVAGAKGGKAGGGPDAEEDGRAHLGGLRFPRLPRGGLIAHPVGSGKTVIAAAFVARATAPFNVAASRGDADGPKTDDETGATLVVCPGHIVGQWLAALRTFAPKLRCRRVDRPPTDDPDRSQSPRVLTPLVATAAESHPDHSPISSLGDWDVIVASYDDVPAFTTPITGAGGSRRDVIDRTRTSAVDETTRPPHPLWDDADDGSPDGAGRGEEGHAQRRRGTRWHRVFFDEPQDLDYTFGRPGTPCGGGAWLMTRLHATHRWGLSATPGGGDALRRVASLLFGQPLSRLTFRRVRARWVAKCCRRDPPGMCLPVPSLTRVAVPITLSWYEASVVQLYSEAFDSSFDVVVRLCSGLAGADEDDDAAAAGLAVGTVGPYPPAAAGAGGETFESMEEWHRRHTAVHAASLSRLERRRDHLTAELKATRDEAATALAAAGGYNPYELMDDLMTEEALHEEDDDGNWNERLDLAKLRESMREQMRSSSPTETRVTPTPSQDEETVMAGVSQLAGRMLGESFNLRLGGAFSRDEEEEDDDGIRGFSRSESPGILTLGAPGWENGDGVRQYVGIDPVQAIQAELDDVNRLLDHARRTLAFVSATAASLRNPKAECSVCFERLRGRTVTVLRCLHAFDRRCVARLLVAQGRMGVNRGGVHGSGRARMVVCPLCRTPTRRKNMCTFIHNDMGGNEVGPGGDGADESDEEEAAGKGEDRVSVEVCDGEKKNGVGDVTAPAQNDNRDGGSCEGLGGVRAPGDVLGAKVTSLVANLKRILSAAPDEKVVIFAQWPETVATAAAALAAAADPNDPTDAAGLGLGVLTLLGNASERANAVASFQSEVPGTPRVLCLSYRMHAAGLNLHRANHVIILHPYVAATVSPHAPDLVPLVEAQAFERQAVGRVLRYPQHRTCTVYRMFAQGTVEEELYAVWGWV